MSKRDVAKSGFTLRDMEERQDSVERRGGGSKSDFFRFPSGDTVLFISKNAAPNDHIWAQERLQLRFPPGANGKAQWVTSPKSRDPQAYCPIAEARRILYDQGDETSARKLHYRRSFLCNGFVQEGNKFKHKLVDLPVRVYKAIQSAIVAEMKMDGIGPDEVVTDPPIVGPTRMRLINVHRTGKDFENTDYAATISQRDVNPRLAQKAMAKLQDVVEVVKPTPVEIIEQNIARAFGWSDFHSGLSLENGGADYEEEGMEEEYGEEEEPGDEFDMDEEEEPEEDEEDDMAW